MLNARNLNDVERIIKKLLWTKEKRTKTTNFYLFNDRVEAEVNGKLNFHERWGCG